ADDLLGVGSERWLLILAKSDAVAGSIRKGSREFINKWQGDGTELIKLIGKANYDRIADALDRIENQRERFFTDPNNEPERRFALAAAAKNAKKAAPDLGDGWTRLLEVIASHA